MRIRPRIAAGLSCVNDCAGMEARRITGGLLARLTGARARTRFTCFLGAGFLAITFFLERSAAKLEGMGEIRKIAKRIRSEVRRVFASRNSEEMRRFGAEKIITELLKMVFSGLL